MMSGWLETESTGLRVCHYLPEGDPRLQDHLGILARTYRRLTQLWGIESAPPITVFLYPDKRELRKRTGRNHHFADPTCNEAHMTQRATPGHEMAHLFLAAKYPHLSCLPIEEGVARLLDQRSTLFGASCRTVKHWNGDRGLHGGGRGQQVFTSRDYDSAASFVSHIIVAGGFRALLSLCEELNRVSRQGAARASSALNEHRVGWQGKLEKLRGHETILSLAMVKTGGRQSIPTDALNEIMKLHGPTPELLLQKARSELRQNDIAAADRTLDAAESLDLENVEAPWVHAFLYQHRGLIHEAQDRLKEAEEYYRRVLRLAASPLTQREAERKLRSLRASKMMVSLPLNSGIATESEVQVP